MTYRIETRDVLAAAYKGKRASLASTHTHAVMVDEDPRERERKATSLAGLVTFRREG